MSETLNILLCEPDDTDAARLIRHLKSHGIGGDVTTIKSVRDVRVALSASALDLFICAHIFPTFDARPALDIVRAADPDLPIIVVSAESNEAKCAALIVAGARDAIVKSDLSRLAPIIVREMAASRTRRNLSRAVGRAELHFRNIVESSLQGIMVRANAKTQFVNSAFCKMFGYSTEELMNLRSTTELHPAYEHDRIKGHVTQRYAGDMSVYEYEIEGVRKDGSLFWCSKKASHVEWDGQPAVQVVVMDITERKTTEKQLAERERNYRETFENAPIAMIRSGYDRKIIEANRAFSEMLGYAKNEVIGLRAGDLVPAGDKDDVIPTIKQVWTRELERVDAEHRMIRKDDRVI